MQRQHPLDGCFQVFVADLVGAVRGHRDLAPVAAAAMADLVEQFAGGALVAVVFGGDVLVGGADAFDVDGVAGDAAGLFDDIFAVDRLGCAGAGEQGAAQNEGE